MAMLDGQSILGFAKSVNLNAVGDTAVTIPNGDKRYIVRRMIAHNASVDMTGSSCTLGAYTAASAGGTAIVTPATGNVTPLSATSKYKDATIAASADSLSASTVYIRVGVVHGAAATCDVYFVGEILP